MNYGATDRSMKLGPTSRFPRGKLSSDDEGELAIGVAVTGDRTIVLHFGGKPVTWIGFAPADARRLADMLREKADEAERL